MVKFAGSLGKYPARSLFLWYLGLIVGGGIVLALPISHTSSEHPVSLVDAVFTATSACCVTGLGVRSTGHDFSFFGQVTIVILVQLGGIGIMTLTTILTLTLSGTENLRQRAVAAETLGAGSKASLKNVLITVLMLTFLIEGAGFLILTGRFLFDRPIGDAMWHGLFHAVSAFCNAGFGLADDNLVGYQGDWVVNLVIMSLVVTGGIGFPVLIDLRHSYHTHWGRWWDRTQIHTKIVLVGTGSLLTLGTVMFLVLEWGNILVGMPYWKRLLVAIFFSVTPRTAGFNTVDYSQLMDTTLFLTILLMAVGGCPCSTAGGFKVPTLVILFLHAVAKLRGLAKVNVYRRTLGDQLIERSINTVLLYLTVAIIGLSVLLAVEHGQGTRSENGGIFLEALFEVFSTLGTVGLTLNYTPTLSTAGKLVIIALMFIGRLGPISMVLALSRESRKRQLDHPKAEILIG